MLFVTASDDRYYDFLLSQIVAIHTNFDMFPVVYDLGLTDTQLRALHIMGVPTDTCGPGPEMGDKYPGTYSPKALFKPGMLLDVCNKYPDEDVVYLDADSVPIRKFTFPCSGIGVIPVSDTVLDAYEGTDMQEYVGPYHSGVVFLSSYEGRIELLTEWRDDLFADPLPSDKKSLNVVLAEREVEALDEGTYNSRVVLPNTRILHYQGLKR